MERNERSVQIAFAAYLYFYERSGLARNRKRAFTFDDFANSTLYGAFVRFARFAIERSIQPEQYIEWALKKRLSIDDWCDESHLEEFNSFKTLNERPHRAIEQTLCAMAEWTGKRKIKLSRFFSEISTAEATLWIRQGRLSPWMLYICERTDELTSRMSEEQLTMMQQYADLARWRRKIVANKDDVIDIRKNVLAPLNLGGIDE